MLILHECFYFLAQLLDLWSILRAKTRELIFTNVKNLKLTHNARATETTENKSIHLEEAVHYINMMPTYKSPLE